MFINVIFFNYFFLMAVGGEHLSFYRYGRLILLVKLSKINSVNKVC